MVAAGTEVPVAPLLKVLEKNLRDNVEKAVDHPNKNARFPTQRNQKIGAQEIDAAELAHIFAAPDPSDVVHMDCTGMRSVIFAEALATTLNPREYANMSTPNAPGRLFSDALQVEVTYTTVHRLKLADTQLGDEVYLPNDPDYSKYHYMGPSRGENSFMAGTNPIGEKLFWSWEDTTLTYSQWRERLRTDYNKDLVNGGTPIALDRIPDVATNGYDRNNRSNNFKAADQKCPVRFFDVAKLAAAIMGYRVANKTQTVQ